MKKEIISLITASLLLMSLTAASPVVSIDLTSGNPLYTEQGFVPLVFLDSGNRLILDDIYSPFDNGNNTLRDGNYAFFGEQLHWKILAWDANGKDDIVDVTGSLISFANGQSGAPERQFICELDTTQPQTGEYLTDIGFTNVRRPGEQTDEEEFDSSTMEVYVCSYITEDDIHGKYWFRVDTMDNSGLVSQTAQSELWFFNPTMSIGINGILNFGTLGPGESSTSSVSISNEGEGGLKVLFTISGTDFHDPSLISASCPVDNTLSLGQFSYSATQGSKTVYNKHIPLGASFNSSDPIFSSGNGVIPNYNSPLVKTSSGSEASLTFMLDLPEPCNGHFTDGSIYIWALLV